MSSDLPLTNAFTDVHGTDGDPLAHLTPHDDPSPRKPMLLRTSGPRQRRRSRDQPVLCEAVPGTGRMS
jgi:hypothetical protein